MKFSYMHYASVTYNVTFKNEPFLKTNEKQTVSGSMYRDKSNGNNHKTNNKQLLPSSLAEKEGKKIIKTYY